MESTKEKNYIKNITRYMKLMTYVTAMPAT